MRIEKISFENINSLAGRFEVDFTHPSLADSGIFLITGPTGAGKTTLLDAIAYGLYGRTPRQGKATATENGLMSHRANYCKATVQFEHAGRRFLATTEQKRTGKAGAIKSFGQPMRRLEEILPNGGAKLLERSVKEVNSKVVELTGNLSFENFTRCMMLAQGEFAAFLKADDKERAGVLSTITGTEIYDRIGGAVHDHVAEIDNKIKEMHPLPTLAAEERKALVEEHALAAAAHEAANKRAEAAKEALDWRIRADKAQKAAGKAKLEAAAAQEALRAFAADGRELRLKRGTAAANAQGHVQAERDCRKRLGDTLERIGEIQKGMEAAAPALQEAEAAKTQAEEQRRRQEPPLAAKLAELEQRMQPQEDEAHEAGRQAKNAQTEAAAKKESHGKALKDYGEAKGRHDAAMGALGKARETLAAREQDKGLPALISGIRSRLQDWEDRDDGSPLPGMEWIRQAMQKNEEARAGQNPQELAERIRLLSALADDGKRLAEAEASLKQKQGAAQAARDAHGALAPRLEAAKGKADDKKKLYEAKLESANLKDKLASLYEKFKAGDLERCPCCGSRVPGERHAVLDGELQAAKQEADEAQKELERLQTQQKKAEKTLRDALTAEAEAKAFCEAQNQRVGALLAKAGLVAVPDDLQEQLEALNARDAELGRLGQEANDLQKQWDLAQVREKFRQGLPERVPLPDSLDAARKTAGELAARADRWVAASNAVAEREKGLNGLKGRLEALESRLETAAAEAKAAEEKAARLRACADEARKRLAEQWGETPCREQMKEARTSLERLKERTKQAADAFNKLDHEQKLKGAELKAKKDDRITQERELAEAEKKRRQSFLECHFADMEAYEAAAAHIPHRESLAREKERLAGEAKTKEALQKREEQALAEILAAPKASPEATPETLQQELDERRQAASQTGESANELKAKILRDDQNIEENKKLEAKLAPLKEERERWELLKNVLGGKKEGFREFAQRITFEQLLRIANKQLRIISDRYVLSADKDSNLGLRITDLWQDGEQGRSCSNLSGGESFMASLALALALSHMAGDTPLDSLFLDEGFGTLDQNALEQVLECLQSLQENGKTVGIISHVEQLNERIPAQLRVTPIGSTGYSTLEPCGAVRAAPQPPGEQKGKGKRKAKEPTKEPTNP